MRWSKLKSEIELRFCDSMKHRVSINSTTYGACSCGHAWITFDKEVIANFCTRAFWNTKPNFDESKKKFIQGININIENKKYEKFENTYGELNRQDVYASCWEYIHDLTIEQAINSDDALIQSLAVIDRRLGKRKLKEINIELLHPLAQKLLKERKKLEIVKKNFC